jgi:hypothetical protein
MKCTRPGTNQPTNQRTARHSQYDRRTATKSIINLWTYNAVTFNNSGNCERRIWRAEKATQKLPATKDSTIINVFPWRYDKSIQGSLGLGKYNINQRLQRFWFSGAKFANFVKFAFLLGEIREFCEVRIKASYRTVVSIRIDPVRTVNKLHYRTWLI